MQLGLALPQFDFSVPGERPPRWGTVVGWAQRAEAAGLDSVWLADHLLYSVEKYGGSAEEHEGLEPFAGLGALAAATERVRLGTLVVCSPLRHPAVVAKMAASLDVLAGGRFILGIGAGWYERDFEAAGVAMEPTPRRLDQLEEAVHIVKGMVGGDPFTFGGDWYRTDGARARPASPQPGGPPVWIGGKGGDRLLATVANVADGWNTAWRWTLDDYRARVEVLRDACAAIGRDPATVALSVGLTTLVGEDEADLSDRYERFVAAAPPGTAGSETLEEFRRGRLVGTVEEVAEQVAGWEDAGVTHLMCSFGAVPFSVYAADGLEMVALARGKGRHDG